MEDIAKLYNIKFSKEEIDEFLSTVDTNGVEMMINEHEWRDMLKTLNRKGTFLFRSSCFMKAERFIRLMESKVERSVSGLKALLLQKVEELKEALDELKQLLACFEKKEKINNVEVEDDFIYES